MKKKDGTRKRLERARVVKVEPLRGSSMQRPPKVHTRSAAQSSPATDTRKENE